ncbi:helix-turn-helix transcriptional regulator [Kibdelosporangium persicum]|uniref:XRE family transcriptional regulator n=1 Tax=Kibdelosporangium persicum TaxID=2698649 RepID=A0ABX2F439_9PSEU|nr:helix-turn-helix transcriptional regulator [Kibdelosporangium persicum]NRN65765.1 XRE family transcriptional regulator [Kibdelosporangium persicum]
MPGVTRDLNFHGRKLLRLLRKLREEAGLTQGDAGEKARIEFRKLSRLELKQLPTYHELVILLDVYGVPSCDFEPYVQLWEMARTPAWWAPYKLNDVRYIRMESEADSKSEFQLGYIPTLLQTERYAQMTFEDHVRLYGKKRIQQLVEVRMRQQDRLSGKQPLVLSALVHEPVLWHGVDREQVLRLIDMAEMPNVTLRVVPQHKRQLHPGLVGSSAILTFSDCDEPDVAFVETMLGIDESSDNIKVSTVKRALGRIESRALDPRETVNLLKQMT